MKTALRIAALTAATGVILGLAVAALAQTAAPAKRLEVARLTTDGKLEKPADLTNWVFLGTSLGMGYNPGSFNAKRPGQFQVVLMEPNASPSFHRTRQLCAGFDVRALVLRPRACRSGRSTRTASPRRISPITRST